MAVKHKNIIFDQWLTQVLKYDVYCLQINEGFILKAGDKTSMEYELLTNLLLDRVFIYTKVSLEATASIIFLESLGFNLVDTNITLSKRFVQESTLIGNCSLRLAVQEDREQVVELARRNFAHSRFHLDNLLTLEIANTIKAEWAGNYFTGNRGDTMVVAIADEIIAGFFLLIFGADNSLIIDLIAVDEAYRRRGIARDLIAFGESQYHEFDKIRVGTQLANVASLKLYEGMGFKIESSQYTFHYHHG